jgi:ATP-binding cassette subfamily C protein LapB
LDCLVELTRIHGRPSTRAALTAPACRSTKGFVAVLVRASGRPCRFVGQGDSPSALDRIDECLLPAVLLLANEEACVLLGWDEAEETARCCFRKSGRVRSQISREELPSRYSGIAIFARPHFRFDKRTPQVGDVKLASLVLGGSG